MTDINSKLLRFNGEVGPQVLDESDKSGGLDGTMKPTTKDMVDVQPIKDELEEIKQQQAQILQRLDEGVDTRLIGSIVELYREEHRVVTAGGRVFITPDLLGTLSGFAKLIINIESPTNHTYEVGINYSDSTESTDTGYISYENQALTNRRFNTGQVRVLGDSLRRISIENSDTNDQSYLIIVWGVV